MCGRYAITTSAARIEAAFDAIWDVAFERPRFNIAPTQPAPVVRAGAPAGRAGAPAAPAGAAAGRRISLLRWGLVPAWADDPAIGGRLINARAETAATKPSFRAAWKARRCLVPMSHFYEWQAAGRQKQPWAIAAAAGEGVPLAEAPLLAAAGLWERWHDELETFTILTTEPNRLMRSLHDRMPVLLPGERWSQWLDPAWRGPETEEEMREWTRPADEGLLRAFRVSTLVNSPRNDAEACLGVVEG